MLITIIAAAAAAVLIYRLGVCDGLSLKKGEKIKMPFEKKNKDDGEREKIQRGIKNILDYGINGGAGK